MIKKASIGVTTMTRVYNEYIEMREKRFNYFPQAFMWHGQVYHVQAVERCWTKMGGRANSRRACRLCFRVRAVSLPLSVGRGDGQATFDIYQDLLVNTWHLEREILDLRPPVAA
jgi:hypothetical protein